MSKFSDDDEALLDELGVNVETKRDSSRTQRKERIIAGLEEIQRFFEQHGRTPQHGEDRDIFGDLRRAARSFARTGRMPNSA